MKHQYFLYFLLGIAASNITFAQEQLSKDRLVQRPLLFSDFPTKLNVNKGELGKIIHAKQSENITIQLNSKLVLSGHVLDNIYSSAGVQNINMRLSNYGNALFHLSVITKSDNKIKIIGRIVHPNHGDALIISEENGSFFITKQKMEFFMVE